MIVVTGWPRSGTSLLMQILVAGGLSPIHHGGDRPRPFNRGGVWEHPLAGAHPVRIVAAHKHDPRACVKIFHRPLQRVLDDGFVLHAVLMTDRSPEAAVRSQETSAPRRRAAGLAGRLATTRATTLAMLEATGTPYVVVPFRPLVDEPAAAVSELAGFLAPIVGELDVAAMAAVPDPSQLHHE